MTVLHKIAEEGKNVFPKTLARTVFLHVAVITVLATSTAHALLIPQWLERLPADAALTAGLKGIVVDDAGVSYVTGITGSSSNTDITTAAFAADGSLLWSHTFNGPQNWHDQSRGITLGPGGVVYVTGNTPGPGFYSNVLLLKYHAATGNLLDSVQYSSGPGISESGGSVATDIDGNVYICGGTVGDGGDALILKFDSDGGFLWKRTWDGPALAPYSQDHADEILVHPNGDPIVMIHGVMSSLHPDYVVIKYASGDGTTVWETNWGVSGADSPRDMELDASGDVYVTGTGLDFTDKFSTIKLRGSDGALLWQAYDSAGLDDYAAAVTLDGEGGVFITGGVDPDGDHSNFNDNIYTVKRDYATGVQTWTHLYGANCVGCYDIPTDVLVDLAGNVFVAGSTSSPPYSADFILFDLDTDTGAEIDRGIISGDITEYVESGILGFDASYNLIHGGDIQDVNTGAVDMAVAKYASLLGDLYRLTVPDLVAGADATFSISNATPSRRQYIVYSLEGLGETPVPGLGVTLDLANPHLGAFGRADSFGSFGITVPVPLRAEGLTLWFQAAEQGRTTPVLSRTVR